MPALLPQMSSMLSLGLPPLALACGVQCRVAGLPFVCGRVCFGLALVVFRCLAVVSALALATLPLPVTLGIGDS